MKYTRASLIEKLTDMGIPVVAGKVKKSDVKKVLADWGDHPLNRDFSAPTSGSGSDLPSVKDIVDGMLDNKEEWAHDIESRFALRTILDGMARAGMFGKNRDRPDRC